MNASPTFEELITTDFAICTHECDEAHHGGFDDLTVELTADDVAALESALFEGDGRPDAVSASRGWAIARSLRSAARQLVHRLH